MKTYIKPAMESVAVTNTEALLEGSIPVQPGTVNPSESLAPEVGGIIEDDFDEL